MSGRLPRPTFSGGSWDGVALTNASLATGATTFLHANTIATITDGGFFGDGRPHAASSNGYATLAALQAAFTTATFIGTGSGTNLTVSGVVGSIFPGDTLGITSGIPAATRIVSQSSGTAGKAGVYVTSQATTISSAAALTSPAQATSDDIASLLIQTGLNQVTNNGGGILALPPGSFVLSAAGLYYDGTQTCLAGAGPMNTTLLCANCAGSQAIRLYGKQTTGRGFIAARDFGMWGLSTTVSNGGAASSQGGTASTTCFNANSLGILIAQEYQGEIEGIYFQNFDRPIDIDHTNGNSWIWTFRRCYFYISNWGISINQGAPNALERLCWQNCVAAGNNYGVYINATNSASLGGAGQGSDFYLDNCAFDYNVVRQINFIGGAALASGDVDDVYPFMRIAGGHMETTSSCSGTTNAPVFNDGSMIITGIQCFLDGTYPPSFVQGTANARLTVQGTMVPGGFPPIPVYSTTGTAKTYRIKGHGNIQRTSFSGDPMLISDSTGIRMEDPSAMPTPPITTTSTSTTLALQRYTQRLATNTSACTLTVLTDAHANHMIGTTLLFITTGNSVWTITPEDGTVTVNQGFGATGLTFGGAAGKMVALTKTAASTWLAYGGMT